MAFIREISMKKKCQICGEMFTATRRWQKYCPKEQCQKKANYLRVLRCRKSHNPLKIKTLEEMKAKEPYKTNYNKIIKALDNKPPFEDIAKKTDVRTRAAYLKRHEKQWEITRKFLMKETELSYYMLSRYLTVLRKFGVINEDFSLSERHKFEALKLRGEDIILNTDMNNIIFHPSPGYSYTYYTPRIEGEYLKYSVKNLNEQVKELEEHLKKADNIWIGILANARDNYVKELWGTEILLCNNIHVFTKFDFCLDWIFRIRKMLLLYTFSSKSFKEKFEEIIRKAFDAHIQEKYPVLNQKSIEKIHTNIQKEYELNEAFFKKISEKLFAVYNPRILEHMITVELLGIGVYRSEELKELNIIKSIPLDNEKPFAQQMKELDKLSTKKYIYDELIEEDVISINRTNEAKRSDYIKPPFFKDFFHEFEQELMELGLKNERLNEFYRVLDETATIIRIPALPDKVELLKRF
jgi:hypothetical protein